FGIIDFADGTDTGLAQIDIECRYKPASVVLLLRIDLQPGINERPDEPCPHSPLMVSRIARPKVAIIPGLVFRIVRRERAQTDWREEFLLHDIEHRLPAFTRQRWMRQRDRKDLIRTAFGVVAIGTVDHVKQISSL